VRRSWAVLTLLLIAATANATAGEIGIGVNYDWWRFSLTSLNDCREQRQPRSVGSWILPSYQDARVRGIVRSQLAAMHRAGFTSLRIMDFYYHTTDAHADDSFTSTDGSIATGDSRKLRDFVRDVAAAGFTSLEVVPSFQAENWLYCRNRAWGDCFEPRRTGENWRFIEQTARTVLASKGTMAVRFDLGNEAAPDPSMPAQTLLNARAYLQTIARRFQNEFGDDWVISAARSDASTASETSTRQELLLDDLAQAGLHPKFLELHLYTADGNDIDDSLDRLQTLARRIGAHVILGELRYHSEVQAAAIGSWIAAHSSSRIADVIQWPEYDPSQICAIDPQPPYTPGPFARAIRNR
jgi:hypothetical protein